jgi:ABC-type polysaccharide/polyol phosphate transport system ATPase subunit
MIDLKLDRISKQYRIQREAEKRTSRKPFVRRLQDLRTRYEKFWALRNVSFEVNRGETLGIIGPNGAGKSTILKLLSRITAPSSGEITINGRLSALIEVGSGFHPELTGRENVYLSGSILGMRRREITERLDSIIDFAGVRQFIDTPVKRYSSGMYVRLGFSIAAHLHPDILLLDEVLAVGDAAFQAKCYKRINELKESGTTIVFISHDLNAIEFLCDRVLLLGQGEIVADGSPRAVLSRYLHAATGATVPHNASNGRGERPRGPIQITELSFHDHDGNEVTQALTGHPLLARVAFAAHEFVADVIFEVFYYSEDGELQCQHSTCLSGNHTDIHQGIGTVEFLVAELGLQPGIYYADATVKRRGEAEEIDWQYRCASLAVDPGKIFAGKFHAPHQWRIATSRDELRIAEPFYLNLPSELPGVTSNEG